MLDDALLLEIVQEINKKFTRSSYEKLLIDLKLFSLASLKDNSYYIKLTKYDLILDTLRSTPNQNVIIKELYNRQLLSQSLCSRLAQAGFDLGSSKQKNITQEEPQVKVARITSRTGIIVAILGLIGTLMVAYWQVGTKSSNLSQLSVLEYTGKVINSATLHPIADAKITLNLEGVPPIVYTDNEGVYRFKVEIKSKTTGQIRVDVPGYQVYTRNITISPETNVIEDVRLSPIPVPSFTPTNTPTSVTSTPTSTPTPTMTPTFTPIPSPTTNPMVFRGLDQECMCHTVWFPYFYPGESKEVDSRNCWNLSEWGITPEKNGLNFTITDPDLRQDVTRRFYTKLKGDAEIKFTVRIDQFTTKPYLDGVLMLGVGDPSTILNSGYFIKYAAVQIDNKVYRDIGPGLKKYYDPRSEYTLGTNQNIIIRIKGSQAKIIADGKQIGSATLSPNQHSVFWIIYSLPSDNGSLTAEVSNLQIEDNQ